MKMVIQRVSRAEVRVDGRVVGRIGRGLVVLVGLERGDGEDQLQRAALRLATLRVFSDGEGRMNLGLDEVGGAVLAVPQFTLAATIRKGRRPGFDWAMAGDDAAGYLREYVRNEVLAGEPTAGPKPERHGRVEMASGDMSDGVGHREHRQAKGDGDTQQTDSHLGECRRQHGTAAPAEDQPEGS